MLWKHKRGNVLRNSHSDRHYLISTRWRMARKIYIFLFLLIYFSMGLEWESFGRRPWSHVRVCTGKATEGLGQLKGKYHRLRHNKWVINKLAADLQKHAQPSVPSLCLGNNTTPRAGKCCRASLHSALLPSRTCFPAVNKSYSELSLLKVKYFRCGCCRADPQRMIHWILKFSILLIQLWKEVVLECTLCLPVY